MQALYELCQTFHRDVISLTGQVKGDQFTALPIEDNSDSCYRLREALKLIEATETEVRRLYTIMQQVTCMQWLSACNGEAIQGQLAVGHPDVKVTLTAPKPDSEGWEPFCEHFGVDPKSPFRPHWPSLIERINAEAAEGKPYPPGVDPSKNSSQFTVRTVKRPK